MLLKNDYHSCKKNLIFTIITIFSEVSHHEIMTDRFCSLVSLRGQIGSHYEGNSQWTLTVASDGPGQT